MNRAFTKLACLILALLLLAACSEAAPSSAVQSSSAVVVSSSAPAETQEEEFTIPASAQAFLDDPSVEEWRKAYYLTVMENLEYDSCTASSLQLYFLDGFMPILHIHYIDHKDSLNRIWTWKEKVPTLVLDGVLGAFSFRQNTGNITWEEFYTDDSSAYYEIIDGKKTLLAEVEYSWGYYGSVPYSLYDMEQNKIFTRPQYEVLDARAYFSLVYAFETPQESIDFSLHDMPILEQVQNFFFEPYSSDLPRGAPEWIPLYLRYIHDQHLYFESGTDDSDRPFVEPEFYILKPAYEGGPPILDFPAYSYEGNSNFHYLQAAGEWGNKVQRLLHTADMGYGCDFYADTRGNPLVRISRTTNGWEWYRMTEKGLEKLCDFNYEEEYILVFYHDGTTEQFALREGNDESYFQIDCKALTYCGYTLQSEPEPLSLTRYNLPIETTWEELEPLLIDIFCTWAKENGQWEA